MGAAKTVRLQEMKNWEFTFTGSWPAAVVILLAAAAALASWRFYRHRKSLLSGRSLAVLTVLRLLLIFVAAMFLLKPVLRFSRTKIERAPLAVLLDASKSMGIEDSVGGQSRLESARELLTARPYEMLDRLARGHSVRVFSFGAAAVELEEPEQVASLRPEQEVSAIGSAMQDATEQVGREGLSAIILLTDGISTRGEDPQKVALRLGVPVYAVALGGRTAERGKFRDIGIADVPRDLEFIVDNRAEIKVRLSSIGLDGLADGERLVQMALAEEDETLASLAVQFPRDDGSLEVKVSYVPKEVGVHRLRLRLPLIPEETVAENNQRTFTVRVRDPLIKTLLLDGVARSEYRFLRRVLESDPNVELTSVVKLRKDRFLVQGAMPGIDLSRGLPAKKEDYEKFEVVILGDIGRDEFTDVQLGYLRDFVEDGGGLFALGGYHSFGAGGYAGSPIDAVLPVVMGGKLDGHAENKFVPRLTPAGLAHPVFAGCGEFFLEGDRSCSLDGANRVKGAKAGAEVLAVHPEETVDDGTPMPVVAAQIAGLGRAIALTADTTWKWKFQIEARGVDSPYYRFWRQGVRWLAGRKERLAEEAPVRAWTNKVEYRPSEPVLISARVRGRGKLPNDGARVEAELSYPVPVVKVGEGGEPSREQSATLKLTNIPLSFGEYEGTFLAPVVGVYTADVIAFDEEGELGREQMQFAVGKATGEFDRIDVDEQALRAIAARTGGQYHSMVTAAKIPEELEERRRRVVYHEEKNLWNAPGFFLVFLACAATEWVLRKKRGLS